MKLKKLVYAIFFEYINFIKFHSFDKHRVNKYKTNKINFNII